MDETYDVVTPHLELDPERTGRRGAPWKLGMTRNARDESDSRWVTTNTEFLTTDELLALRAEIDRALTPVGTAGKRIDTRAALVELARELGVRPDWHEPDEHEVTAKVHGDNFDNAGFWGRNDDGTLHTFGGTRQEIWVELFQEGEPVAEINLATLLAFATGYEG